MFQKEQLIKTAEATGDLTGNKIAELHHIIVQEQSEMKQKILGMIKKYLKKDI